ncbi:hypothetical protein EDD27_0285 [Nonomuraea polychroma]|uniref:Uncharacterized protein n=1 Tax=Nonomuraea polychroma TaxID=46176 RepID=A0A438LWU4_9ACTN|nr:hypothetical protein [Nonomuraea polychroma]RVX37995.1 hypothetical protein EDD27_0285 [Nonomuraea polychroma]
MSLLERRYRGVLRLLPASYRAEREEEMVAAFMEAAGDVPDEVNPRPGWGEIASVLGLALRVRIGGTLAAPRAYAWGEAVRLVALLGLAYQTVYAVFVAADLYRALTFEADPNFAGAPGSIERLLSIAESVATLCSAIAFVAITRGHPRLAKVTALIGAMPALGYAATGAGPLAAGPNPGGQVASAVFVLFPVAALMLGFHRDVAPRRRSWGLALSPIIAGLVTMGGVQVMLSLRLHEHDWLYLWLDLIGMSVLALAAESLFVLVRGRSPAWALALSAAASLLLLVRLPMMIDNYGNAPNAIPWLTMLEQCVLLIVLIGVLAGTGLKALPRS